MRYDQIISEKILRKPTEEALAAAAAEGFDTKFWYHGTRRRFNAFELNKRKDGGIDELGPGIYLTSKRWLANTWAKDGGHLLTCVIRKGPLFDLEKVRREPTPDVMQLLAKGYIHYHETHWPHPTDRNYKITYNDFLAAWKGSRYPDSLANLCLSEAGYIGGYRVDSQVEGQVVIFKSEDVKIIARNGGKRYMSSFD